MRGHPIPELGGQFSPHRPGSGIGFLRGGLFQAGAWGQLNRESKGYRTCMMSSRNSDALAAHTQYCFFFLGFSLKDRCFLRLF